MAEWEDIRDLQHELDWLRDRVEELERLVLPPPGPSFFQILAGREAAARLIRDMQDAPRKGRPRRRLPGAEVDLIRAVYDAAAAPDPDMPRYGHAIDG